MKLPCMGWISIILSILNQLVISLELRENNVAMEISRNLFPIYVQTFELPLTVVSLSRAWIRELRFSLQSMYPEASYYIEKE